MDKSSALDYINQMFPTEASLSGVEPLMQKIHSEIRCVDVGILAAVRQQIKIFLLLVSQTSSFILSIQQHKQNTAPDSLSYMQMHSPFLQLDNSHPLDQISLCPTPSSIKSENNGHMSPSPKESSYASNQVQSMESSHGPSFEAPSVTTNEERENPFHCQDVQATFTRSFKHANIANPMTFCNSLSVRKQICQSELDNGGQSEVDDDSIGVPAKLDSSNVQESSCMSSVLDEISLEATSFRQLQQIMEKESI